MKIFITNIEDKGEQDALLDGTCDICFEWGYYTQYLVSFCMLMSDGTVYDIAHDGVVDYDYDEDGTSDLYGYTQTGPIKNVLKFVSDIKTIDFPDIEFFESYEEYREAWRSDRMVIPLYISSQKNKHERDDAIRNKMGSFLMEVIKNYADDGVDGNPDEKITPLYVGGRADGSDKQLGALKRFLREVIRAYAIDQNSYYKGELDGYIRNLPSHLI